MSKSKLKPIGDAVFTVRFTTTERQYTLTLLNNGEEEESVFTMVGSTKGERQTTLKYTGSAERCLEEFLYWCNMLRENPDGAMENP